MGKKPLTRSTLPYFCQKLEAMSADEPRRWGKLTPTGLMQHCRRTFALSLGDLDMPPVVPRPLQPVLRVLFFEVFTTWPGGAIKAPDYLEPGEEGEFEAERAALIAMMERFVAEAEATPDRTTNSPAIGPTPLRYWQKVHGLHLHHHFRQFGLV